MYQTEYNSRELALRDAYIAGTISFETLDAAVATLRRRAGLTEAVMKTQANKLEEMAMTLGTLRGIFLAAAIIGDYTVEAREREVIITFEDGSEYGTGDDQ